MKTKNTHVIMKMYYSISKAPPEYLSFMKNKGFTLIELIIVITILAILATISFLGFKNYIGSVRDSNKLVTFSNIEKGLTLYQIKTGYYPDPDKIYGTGIHSGLVLSKIGYIGGTLAKVINFNTLPLDPIGESMYTYGLSGNGKYYQLGTVLENTQTTFIPTTSASNYISKIVGNYKGIYVFATGGVNYVTNLPSLIFTQTGNVSVEPESNIKFVINNGENLVKPYDENNNTDINHILLKKTGTGVLLTFKNISNINWETQKQELVNELGYNEEILSSEIFPGGNVQKQPHTPPLGCTYLGENIFHSGSLYVYSENNIPWNASYDCQDRKGIVNCNNGVVTGDITYQYKQGQCSKGVPNHCQENTNYTLSGKTFQVPQLEHGSTLDTKSYLDIEENNGTFRYELTVTCTDGVLDGSISLPQGQFCDPGYILNELGTSCTPKNCDTVTIDGYNIPTLNHGVNNVNITKILPITGGSQTWSGKFSCNLGIVTSTSSQPTNLVCNAGYYKTDINTCTLTSIGYYSLSGAMTQTVCGNGKYQDQVGQGSCKTCTNKIENSTYIVSSALTSNTCPWSCSPGYGYNGTSCVPATQCVSGLEYITIGNGQSWACKNVGATSVWNGTDSFTCTSSTNCSNKPTYAGNYYQWGKDDISWTLGQSAQPYYYGWEATNNTRWGSNSGDLFSGNGAGTTSVGRKGDCDVGWHIPSAYEWQEMCKTLGNTSNCASTSATKTAIQSALKFPYTGLRAWDTGNYGYVNDTAYYWGSSPYYNDGVRLAILKNSETISIGPAYRAFSMQIRCIKNNW